MKVPCIETIQDIDKILCSAGNCKLRCAFNRTEQCFCMSIQKVDDTRVSLKVLQFGHFWLPIGYFTLDNSMSLEFVHGENISDVLYDCGTKGVRIDWEAKKFRWLSFESDESYYRQINKLVTRNQVIPSSICYFEDVPDVFPNDPFPEFSRLDAPSQSDSHQSSRVLVSIDGAEMFLLESDGKFIVVGKTKDNKFFVLFPVRHPGWYKAETYVNYDKRSFMATVLGPNIFIVTQKLKFIQFNYENSAFKKTKLFRDNELKFGNLILTSCQNNDNIVILIDKSSGKIHIFNIASQTWIETGQIKNRKHNATSDQNCTSDLNNDSLMTLATVFLPLDEIKPCFKRKRSLSSA